MHPIQQQTSEAEMLPMEVTQAFQPKAYLEHSHKISYLYIKATRKAASIARVVQTIKGQS
jgi:hypothetical protein